MSGIAHDDQLVARMNPFVDPAATQERPLDGGFDHPNKLDQGGIPALELALHVFDRIASIPGIGV